MHRFKKYFRTSALVIMGVWANTNFVQAQEYQATPCDEAQYSALAQIPGGELSVYMKAGRKEDSVSSKVFYRSFDAQDCKEIGSATLNTKSYQRAGSLTLPEGVNLSSIFVKIDNNVDKQAGASVPQVVFTSSIDAPCDLTAACKVKFQEQDFLLAPKKVSLSSDTLVVGVLSSFSSNIKEVLYTVDGKPAYTKPVLEEFNLNYVPDGEHTLSRTIVLKDGQSLSDSKVVKRGLEGGATYLFISILYGQSRLLRYAGVLIGFLIAYSLFTLIIKHIVAKRRWKSEHFFDPSEHFDTSSAGAKRGLTGEETYGQLLRHYKKYFISGLVFLGGVFLINQYGLTLFTVDGVSMYPTLENTSKRLLYTFPVTVGKLNKNYYLPARGTVVVVQKDDNNLFESNLELEKSYVVKRVIGLPNERVVIKDSKILVYNKDNEKGFEPDAEFNWVKDLKGSESISMNIKLKEGEIFVVGDNRDESIDSRFYGPVQTSHVVGKVL